jgi:hypothetical protein
MFSRFVETRKILVAVAAWSDQEMIDEPPIHGEWNETDG